MTPQPKTSDARCWPCHHGVSCLSTSEGDNTPSQLPEFYNIMAGDNGSFKEPKKLIDGSGFDCSTLFTNIFLPVWGTKIAKAVSRGGTLQNSLSCLYKAPITLDPWRPWVCTPCVSPIMYTVPCTSWCMKEKSWVFCVLPGSWGSPLSPENHPLLSCQQPLFYVCYGSQILKALSSYCPPGLLSMSPLLTSLCFDSLCFLIKPLIVSIQRNS